jgi:hypothetical protein
MSHTIFKVRDMLKQTIANKEKVLSDWGKNDLVATFLELNINEFKTILVDIEVCCEESVADSWRGETDRMGM